MKHKVTILPKLMIGLVLASLVLCCLPFQQVQGSNSSIISGTKSQPFFIGGASGNGDARDADLYPVVAYDPLSGRYLVVWMTPRHAGSSSGGFDVYGQFVSNTGQMIGGSFLISNGSANGARSDFPVIVAGKNEFLVAWTDRGYPCQVLARSVTNTSMSSIQVLASSGNHRHSPALEYNTARQRYTLVYADGDDYMPPKLFGAQTTDCGNNSYSSSQVNIQEFTSTGWGGVLSPVGQTLNASGSVGAFRPRVAFNGQQYLVAWEDRRNSGGQTNLFSVYAQRLDSNGVLSGSNLVVQNNIDVTNFSTDATWTPRPFVTGGVGKSLVTWYDRQVNGTAVVWSARASFISSAGNPSTPFVVFQNTYADASPARPPSGFISVAQTSPFKEYLFGITAHIESVRGYYSLALIQRMNENGGLINFDGTPQSTPSIGISVDPNYDDQIAASVAGYYNLSGSQYLMVYSRHTKGRPEEDLDIYGSVVRLPNNPLWLNEFGNVTGGWRMDRHLRVLGDVNGDGKADVVGFGDAAVYVALSTGSSFMSPVVAYQNFAYYNGGWQVDRHPRMVADVNGDGKGDLVGFGDQGVYVALSTSSGNYVSFGPMQFWFNGFGILNGGWTVSRHPRILADVNGDGKADIVGFGDQGVYVALSTGSSFGPMQFWLNDFGYVAGGWRVERHPRMLADMNNDGKADIVGFGDGGVYVALSNGNGFGPIRRWSTEFGYLIGGWRVDQHPRTVLVDKGTCNHIIGFGSFDVYAADSTCSGFTSSYSLISINFTVADGWMVNRHPRMTGDVNGDGKGDIVGFGDFGVSVTIR
jgi:hypothetical protein